MPSPTLPLVSIIIPVYNGRAYLAQAIESALNQSYPNIELLVIDDGSTDGGEAARIADAYQGRVHYIKKENGGVSSALNIGIASMKGEYFSWLSHDDVYHHRKISSQISLINRLGNPRQIVTDGYILFNDSKGIVGSLDIAGVYPQKRFEAPLFPVFHCALNGCAMLIHKSHFDRVGLFDESKRTTQDYDMWFRMLRGQKAVYGRQFVLYSRVHSEQVSVSIKTEHEAECTNLWIDLLEQLTDDEMIAMAGSVKAFFDDVYSHFLYRTSYRGVCEYIKARWNPDERSAPLYSFSRIKGLRLLRAKAEFYQWRNKQHA